MELSSLVHIVQRELGYGQLDNLKVQGVVRISVNNKSGITKIRVENEIIGSIDMDFD